MHEDVAEARDTSEAPRERRRKDSEGCKCIDGACVVGYVVSGAGGNVRRDVERVLGAQLEPTFDNPSAIAVGREFGDRTPLVWTESLDGLIEGR